MIYHKSDKNSKKIVIKTLLNNGIVILPTDTVYGFSGITKSETTDSRIRKIKGREETKPFIQLISNPKEIKKYTDDKIPSKILKYWPGPLTIIVNDKRQTGVTTAFRCPGDKWLRQIIKKCKSPVYSTSVNRSGSPVLDNEKDIVDEFELETDLIILDGEKKGSLPSTIIKIVDDKVEVLRQGSLKIDI